MGLCDATDTSQMLVSSMLFSNSRCGQYRQSRELRAAAAPGFGEIVSTAVVNKDADTPVWTCVVSIDAHVQAQCSLKGSGHSTTTDARLKRLLHAGGRRHMWVVQEAQTQGQGSRVHSRKTPHKHCMPWCCLHAGGRHRATGGAEGGRGAHSAAACIRQPHRAAAPGVGRQQSAGAEGWRACAAVSQL